MGNYCGLQHGLTTERIENLAMNSHFKKRQIKKYHNQFMKVATTGSLTRAQFVTLYNTISDCYNADLLAEHMFRVFATKNNYSIDFDEFLACLSVTTRGTLSEQIEWIFRLYDIDGDGFIVMSEITGIMQAANINQTSSNLLRLFKKMDKNDDGKLSFEEFSSESLNDLTFLRFVGMQTFNN